MTSLHVNGETIKTDDSGFPVVGEVGESSASESSCKCGENCSCNSGNCNTFTYSDGITSANISTNTSFSTNPGVVNCSGTYNNCYIPIPYPTTTYVPYVPYTVSYPYYYPYIVVAPDVNELTEETSKLKSETSKLRAEMLQLRKEIKKLNGRN